jgi:hypothetical protein
LPRRPRALCAVALTLLWGGGCRLTSEWLAGALEARAAPLAASEPPADAIVVLGGGLLPAIPPRRGPELADAGDRVLEAARLWREGRAPRIVACGGSLDGMPAEADALASLLRFLGVAPEAILQDRRSRTTHENAMEARRLLEPLGLDATWYQAVETARAPLAHGYRLPGTKLTVKPVDLDDRSGVAPFRSVVTAAGGAGSMAGTSGDLARWGRALYSGRVLGPQGTATLLGAFTRTTSYLPGVAYGYGVQALSIDGHPSLGHSGRLLGFRSAVRHFPLDGLTIAVLTNQSRADPGVVVRALLAAAVAPPPTGPVCPACLRPR